MSKISAVIQKMQNDIEYRTYFFKNVPKYQSLHLWLKPLYDKGYFSPKHNANPIEDENNKGYYSIPHWEVLDFLEAVAIQNKETVKEEITNLLLEISNSVINYCEEDGKKIDNYRTDWYMIKIIFMLPIEYISTDHIDYIGMSIRESKFGSGLFDSGIGETVMPVLIENDLKEHLLHLLPILFEYKTTKDGFKIQDRIPIIEKYWLHEITKKYSKEIAKVVGVDGIMILEGIMKEVIMSDSGSFNNVWISTIEEHKQNSFPDRYDNQIVSFIRDILEEISPDELNETIQSLLEEEHPIFKRLAFHTLNHYYESLKEIFWVWFKSEDNIIDTTYRHEQYKLLQDRASLFSPSELDTIVKWIESLDYSKYYEDRTTDEQTYINAYKRKEWLLTIKDYNTKAHELYDTYNELSPEEIEHPGFDIWNSGVRRLDKNPIKDDEKFCRKSVSEILEYINTFDPDKVEKDPLMNTEDWIDGLAGVLGLCIQKDPQKFVSEIEFFNSLDHIYFYYIFDGLERAWKEKEKFDWGKVFEFIETILDDNILESEEKYAIWVKGKIPELIKAGTLSDDNAFSKEYLPKAKKILFDLLNHRENDDVSIDRLLSYSLNATNGKILHGLMSYALRYGRLHSDTDVKWEEDIKSFFDVELTKNENYSLYVFNILGDYLSNLRFLDRKWVEDKFNEIFPMEKELLWEASIMSYMASSTVVYENTYKAFNNGGHFEKALEYDFKDDHVKEKIIQHIAIAYMNDFDNETIYQVINEKNLESNLDIIRFIWHTYRDNKPDNIEKIYKLWEIIFELHKDESTDDEIQIFSTLSKWFVFVVEINDTNLQWLKLSAKYTEKNYNSYIILEELLRLVEANANSVGKIFLEMLNNDVFPTYKEENIVAIVEKLFQLEESENARIICNMYAKNGIYFLNEITKKY